MLKEYAVDPMAIGQSWSQFRFLINEFGFDRGRLISRLPERWEKKVIQAAKESGVGGRDLLRIIERLNDTKTSRKILGNSFDYDGGKDWLENAILLDKSRGLKAIVSNDKVAELEKVITPNDIEDDHELWSSSHDWRVPRTGADIANAIAPLLLAAKEIRIIDAFFDFRPGRGHFVDTLREILALLARGKAHCDNLQIHYRTRDDRPPIDLVERSITDWLDGVIPPGFSISLFEWQPVVGGQPFHDRHLLCDCGGLSIGHGFDAPGAHEKANISVHSFEIVRELTAEFEIRTSPHNLIQPVLRVFGDGNVQRINAA